MVMLAPNSLGTLNDDRSMSFPKALKMLEDQGADVVGLNCFRGPDTMIDLMKEVRQMCKVSTTYIGYMKLHFNVYDEA